ncbi:hypothetical protein M758_7G064100 [Ceratodon purpureus]|nr:hypothetical protein M758_7G064100 [Ceratodon purpureus]
MIPFDISRSSHKFRSNPFPPPEARQLSTPASNPAFHVSSTSNDRSIPSSNSSFALTIASAFDTLCTLAPFFFDSLVSSLGAFLLRTSATRFDVLPTPFAAAMAKLHNFTLQ